MKPLKITFFLLFILSVGLQAQSIITVNNNPNSLADHSTFQAAVDAASSGDIIMVYGSATSYGHDTIDKPLAIIGPGYFLTANPNTQVNPTSAKFSGLYIGAGASGTMVTGLEFYGTSVFSAGVKIELVNNIIISRNYIKSNSDGYDALRIYNSSNIQVNQNYIDNNYSYNTSSSSYTNSHDAEGIAIIGSNGINIKNNIIEASLSPLYISGASSCIFNNNIFRAINYLNTTNYGSRLFVNNSTFENNILINTYTTNGSNYSAQNNICTHTTFGTSSGNQSNVAENTIFVGAAGNSPDGRWQLSTTSPALGTGLNGVDCGIFGGTDPYILSGIPFVPNIYELNMPNSGTSGGGINVNVKIKANQ